MANIFKTSVLNNNNKKDIAIFLTDMGNIDESP